MTFRTNTPSSTGTRDVPERVSSEATRRRFRARLESPPNNLRLELVALPPGKHQPGRVLNSLDHGQRARSTDDNEPLCECSVFLNSYMRNTFMHVRVVF
jgi:hypothetical protein